jgi:hypothetical protein
MMLSTVLRINVKTSNSLKLTNKRMLQKKQKVNQLIFIHRILKMTQKMHKSAKSKVNINL